jgi:FeS assembly SUF system protein
MTQTMTDSIMIDAPPPEPEDAGPPHAVTQGPDPAVIAAIVKALKTVYDPEIPVNIWELGLVYLVDVDAANDVFVRMTVTAPSCPVAGELPGQVQAAVETVEAVGTAKVDLVWDPPWHPGMMSDVAKVALDMY